MSDNQYQKLHIALQHYLYGAKYYRALKAFDLAKRFHTGVRKDNVTPEFQHQIEIALFITTLKDVVNEEDAIVVALLHDLLEDYVEVTQYDIDALVGLTAAQSVVVISKKIQGKNRHVGLDRYFNDIGQDQEASIVKGCDRIRNLQTMGGAFSIEKQQEYIQETKEHFLPMLKRAAGIFPMQYLAYMNIRTVLKSQIELLEACIQAELK
ncbi:MAG: hypothetical protein CTY12_06275 [Methylotenera sp.]|nr:MAG: hypothetical protein CTY12_06275 [Methylotenera sp.]